MCTCGRPWESACISLCVPVWAWLWSWVQCLEVRDRRWGSVKEAGDAVTWSNDESGVWDLEGGVGRAVGKKLKAGRNGDTGT